MDSFASDILEICFAFLIHDCRKTKAADTRSRESAATDDRHRFDRQFGPNKVRAVHEIETGIEKSAFGRVVVHLWHSATDLLIASYKVVTIVILFVDRESHESNIYQSYRLAATVSRAKTGDRL